MKPSGTRVGQTSTMGSNLQRDKRNGSEPYIFSIEYAAISTSDIYTPFKSFNTAKCRATFCVRLTNELKEGGATKLLSCLKVGGDSRRRKYGEGGALHYRKALQHPISVLGEPGKPGQDLLLQHLDH